MNLKQSGRRRFIKHSAALASLAAGVIEPASSQTSGWETADAPSNSPISYGARSRFVTTVRGNGGAFTPRTPLQDQMGIITPASLHHVVTHTSFANKPSTSEGWGPIHPEIDPEKHRLLIHGMVDRPLGFTLQELKRLPRVSRIHFIECAVNSGASGTRARSGASGIRGRTVQETHGFSSCSEWTGVLLSVLLKEAGAQKGGSWIIAEGADVNHHLMSSPIEKAMDDCLVAYGQNGEPVRPEQGYPLRLVVPGFEGVRNIKWLRRIKVVDQPYMPSLESIGYVSLRPDGKGRWFQFEMPPISVIARPSGGQQLAAGRGFYEIIGLAWSGGGAIRWVEVSTDGGHSWKDAQIQEPIHRKAHSMFRFPWHWDGREAVLQSRCTDELGAVQPTLAEMNRLWGVTSDYWLATTNYINHFNIIWSWKVTQEGSVHNAIFES